MAETIALIDGDIYAYQVAAAAEEGFDWEGDGIYTISADEGPARVSLIECIQGFAETVGATRIIVALTDKVNWRKAVLPSYKMNRKEVRKPLLLKAMMDCLRETFEVFERPTLEADDVLGILSTGNILKGKKIIVTGDKDLQTIPGYLYLSHKPELGVRLISEAEADRYHLFQSITGDITDGYSGCPGLGPKGAEEVLTKPFEWEPYQHIFKSGKRKGLAEIRWRKTPTDCVWSSIVSQFNKIGMSEEEALVQARVARICRASDYDFKKKEVILWEPQY